MTKKLTDVLIIFIAGAFILTGCGKAQIKEKVEGNKKIVIAEDGGKVTYKIVYTLDGDKIVSGEYYEPAGPDAKKTAKKTNILADTEFAKKIEASLKDKDTSDNSSAGLDEVKDGFVLKFVKKVTYNEKKLPVKETLSGYKSIPVIGFFNIKTEIQYSYDNKGLLKQIVQKSKNIDTVLLTQGIVNVTTITRDSLGRPTQVSKLLGSIPPAVEKTEYYYNGKTDAMAKTVYHKAGIDLKKLTVVPDKTITFLYNNDVPWNGKKKYHFSFTDSKNAVSGFSIYNEKEKKSDLDLSNFSKMGFAEKATAMKQVYDLYTNEQAGPTWRMGDLADIPEPFLVYRDCKWWK